MNAIVQAPAESSFGISTAGMAPGLAIMFNDALYERCKQIAGVMSRAAGFTPEHLIGKTEACFAVVTRAITWKLDPLAVGQSTYSTPGGKIGYEGKLVQAILENSGHLEGGVKFEHFGDWARIRGKWKKVKSERGKEFAVQGWTDAEEEGLGVIVSAKIKGEKDPRELTVYMRECFPRNSTLWALRPSQQICYTAVRAFANVAAPGLFMGVPFNSDLEMGEMIDVTPSASRPSRADYEPSARATQADAAPAGADGPREPAEDHQADPAPAAGEDDADELPTGEIEAEPEFSAADAYERGRKERDLNKALRAVPPEWRDNQAFQPLADAWGEGWRSRDDEIAANAKPGRG